MDPAITFRSTPDSFSDVSRITGVEKRETYSGIILDTPEDVRTALLTFGGQRSVGEHRTIAAIGDDHGGFAAVNATLGFALIGRGGSSLVERIAEDAATKAAKGLNYHESFDYDAAGTAFFKTSVNVSHHKGYYLLHLYVAHAGKEHEQKLAEQLGVRSALSSANATAVLSRVDAHWFDIPLEDVLLRLPVGVQSYEAIAKQLVDRNNTSDLCIPFIHEGRSYVADMRLDVSVFTHPKAVWEEAPRKRAARGKKTYMMMDGLELRYAELEAEDAPHRRLVTDRQPPYLQARGTHVVGAAWSDFDEQGASCVGCLRDPRIEFSVRNFSQLEQSAPLWTQEEIDQTIAARDYFATHLRTP